MAGAGSLDCDHHVRVPVVQQASGTVLARGINPRQSCGCMLQEDGPLGIEIGPAGTKDFIEIRRTPVREQHHARQCARILVDIRVAGAPDEDEIAGLERAVDFLDRHAGCNEPYPKKIRKCRMVGGIKRREGALGGERDGVADVSCLIEGVQPQRVVTKDPVEVLGERKIGPVIIDTDELDAVAPIRCRRSGEPRPDQPHRCIAGILAQRVEPRGRQRGGHMRSVVPPRSAVMKPAMSATAVSG